MKFKTLGSIAFAALCAIAPRQSNADVIAQADAAPARPAASAAPAPAAPAARPAAPARPRYNIETIEPALPPLRIPLVYRLRPEAPTPREEYILNLQANTNLHTIPPLRTTPAPSVRPLDALDAGYPQPLSAPPPDTDAPVPAQAMPVKRKL